MTKRPTWFSDMLKNIPALEHGALAVGGARRVIAASAVPMPGKPLPMVNPISAYAGDGRGVMIAFMFDVATHKAVKPVLPANVLVDEPSDPHITLSYYGKLSEDVSVAQIAKLANVLKDFCGQRSPLVGSISGVGRFTAEPKDCVWAAIDVPGLSKLRSDLLEMMERAGCPSARGPHDFIPHMTLGFIDDHVPLPPAALPKETFQLGALSLVVGGRARTFPLGGEVQIRESVDDVLTSAASVAASSRATASSSEIEKKVLSVKSFPDLGYELRDEIWRGGGCDTAMNGMAYAIGSGAYIGDERTVKALSEMGIRTFEPASPDGTVASIGFAPKHNKWFGWSHRAIYGYGIGETVKAGDMPESCTGMRIESVADSRHVAVEFAKCVASAEKISASSIALRRRRQRRRQRAASKVQKSPWEMTGYKFSLVIGEIPHDLGVSHLTWSAHADYEELRRRTAAGQVAHLVAVPMTAFQNGKFQLGQLKLVDAQSYVYNEALSAFEEISPILGHEPEEEA